MKYKSGFTLAELLVTFAIIGVLTTAAIITFKPYDKGIKYVHSNTYYVLNKAYYNVMNYYRLEEGKQPARDPFQVEDSELGTHELAHSTTNDGGTEKLCKGLIHYINYSSENCSSTPVSSSALADGGTFPETPHFTAVNGVKYYISERLGTHDKTSFNRPGIYFYLIFADMNGDKYPNSGRYEPGSTDGKKLTKDPDVFTFAALEPYDDDVSMSITADAQIIPIGISEFEPRYMQSRVVYSEAKSENEDEFLRYSNHSVPYYLAKCMAWGYYKSGNKIGTLYDFADADPSKITFMNDPHTYSDYVRGVLAKSDRYKNSFILKNIERWQAKQAAVLKEQGFISSGTITATQNSCMLNQLRALNPGSDFNGMGVLRSVHQGGKVHVTNCGFTSDLSDATNNDFSDSCSVIVDKYLY